MRKPCHPSNRQGQTSVYDTDLIIVLNWVSRNVSGGETEAVDSEGLRFVETKCYEPDDSIEDVLNTFAKEKNLQGKPVIVCDRQDISMLHGILTPFDLLSSLITERQERFDSV
jgi:hypothetical protein